MKKGFYILMILCAALMVVSCDKTKSYTERLKDERKAIDRLIDHEGFKILKNYPSDGVFKENEFVKLDNDVYLNVCSSDLQVMEIGQYWARLVFYVVS